MNDLLTARAQRNITYAWLVGFFALLFMEGLGYIKEVPRSELFTLTGAVLFFWFNRSRNQEVPPANTQVTSRTLEPVPNETIKEGLRDETEK